LKKNGSGKCRYTPAKLAIVNERYIISFASKIFFAFNIAFGAPALLPGPITGPLYESLSFTRPSIGRVFCLGYTLAYPKFESTLTLDYALQRPEPGERN
jgi:hypothetical protein